MLDDILSDDAAFAFCDTDTFAESVSYLPRGGTARTITAVVTRKSPDDIGEQPSRFAPELQVFIRRHATAGVLSVDTEGDTVTVATDFGGTAEKHRIVDVISQDAGGFLLRLR